MATGPQKIADSFFDIDAREVEEFTDALIAEFDQIINQEAATGTRQSLDVMEASIVGFTPVNFGILRDSISSSMSVYPGQWGLYTGDVGSPVDYAAPVEFGRRPGKRPPIGPIKLWAMRKLGLRGPELETAAYLIARSIGRRGTKGAHMFSKGFDNAIPYTDRVWDAAAIRMLTRIGTIGD